MASRPVLSASPFETQFFGGPVLRLTLEDEPAVAQLPEVLHPVFNDRAAKLVSCRFDSSWSEAVRALEAFGFRKVETLVTLEGPTSAMEGGDVEYGRQSDEQDIESIGRAAFSFDRFHADPDVPKAVADNIKGAWVVNNLRGRADANIVVRENGRVTGFAQCLLHGDAAIVDLIAVAPERAGRGGGARLMSYVNRHYAAKAARIRAGTQAANLRSLAMYRRLGMAAQKTETTMHWSPDRREPANNSMDHAT